MACEDPLIPNRLESPVVTSRHINVRGLLYFRADGEDGSVAAAAALLLLPLPPNDGDDEDGE